MSERAPIVLGKRIERWTAASLYADAPDFYREWVLEDEAEFKPEELARLALLFGLRT